MSKIKNNGISVMPYLFAVILCVIISSSAIALCTVDKYMWLVFLPVSFAVFSIFFSRVYTLMLKSVTVTLLIALMMLKNVFIPLLMALGDGIFSAQVDTSDKMFAAVMLQIYEEFVLFLVLHFRYKSLKNAIKDSYVGVLSVQRDKVRYFSFVTITILIVAVICFVLYPELIYYFSVGGLGSTENSISHARAQIAMRENVPTLIYYTFGMCISLLRWLVPAMVMFRMYLTRKSETKKIFVSYIFIGISVLLATDTLAISVFIAITYILVLSKMYPKHSKKILLMSGMAVLLAAFSVLILKSFGEGRLGERTVREVANMLQAYFSGPDNVAVALSIEKTFSIKELLGDVLRFVPYLMYFFKDLPTSNAAFNETFFGNTSIVTQIMPMIAQGARHFTVILAPIYTALISSIAIRWETKATSKNSLLDYTVCAIGCVCFSMSVAMYSASLSWQLYLNYVFPIQLIVWFVKKTRITFRDRLVKE